MSEWRNPEQEPKEYQLVWIAWNDADGLHHSEGTYSERWVYLHYDTRRSEINLDDVLGWVSLPTWDMEVAA